MSEIEPKYEQIARDIENRISNGDLPVGAVMPSYRKLMGEYGVALGTVRQAVSQLQNAGLVTGVVGRGCVVSRPKQTWRHIGLASFGLECDALLRDEMVAAQPILMRLRLDLSVRFLRYDAAPEIEEFVAWGHRMDGVLIRGRVSGETVERLVNEGIPVVLVGELGSGRCPRGAAKVSADLAGMIRIGVSHLVGLGHRRILWVTRDWSNYYREINASFAEQAERHGLGEDARQFVINGYEEEGEVEHVFVPYIESCDPRPTAVFAEGSDRCLRLMERARQAGLRIPEDLSFFTLAAKPMPGRPLTGLSYVCASGDTLLRAIEMLGERLDHKDAPVRWERIPCDLCPGETCCPLAAAVSGTSR